MIYAGTGEETHGDGVYRSADGGATWFNVGLRETHFTVDRYRYDYVTLQVGIELLIGLIVGWLLLRLERQTDVAETRAAEAERLRDHLGRRADVLEAANRCARARSGGACSASTRTTRSACMTG